MVFEKKGGEEVGGDWGRVLVMELCMDIWFGTM